MYTSVYCRSSRKLFLSMLMIRERESMENERLQLHRKREGGARIYNIDICMYKSPIQPCDAAVRQRIMITIVIISYYAIYIMCIAPICERNGRMPIYNIKASSAHALRPSPLPPLCASLSII